MSTIASIKPTLENVIPWKQYQLHQPRALVNNDLYDDKDGKLILYGGGREFMLRDLDKDEALETELYILEGRIIIWIKREDVNRGVEIPNESILYHGVRLDYTSGREGHQLELILSLARDPVLDELLSYPPSSDGPTDETSAYTMSSLEIILKPKYSIYDRYYNEAIETLFTFENFGLNRGDDLVDNCQAQLALSLEHTPEQEDEYAEQDQEEELEEAIPMSLADTLSPPAIGNTGTCDDLDDTQFNYDHQSSYAIEQSQLDPPRSILGHRRARGT
ncbi:Protein LOT5 [Nakaseomyces bracarensis]|uniref:Protein LOT5 n=1 Tax=Nakaseomyces bracarensis TaxID=273131 RepID=A0ABR4NNH7_9SACH